MRSLALGRVPHGARPEEWLCAGPFCLIGREEEFPEWERRFTFAPEPLADPKVLAKAAKTAQSLCMAGILAVSQRLDPVNFEADSAYWQILLAPFSMDLARQLVERAIRCEAMIRAWGNQELFVRLLPDNCGFHFSDERDFTLRGALGESFNHWLFSRVLERAWPGRWRREYLPEYDDRMEPGGRAADKKDHIKDLFRGLMLRMPFPRLKGMTALQSALFSKALAHPLKRDLKSVDLTEAFYRPELLKEILLPENYESFFIRFLPKSAARLKKERLKRGKTEKKRLRIASPAAYENAEYRQRLAKWKAEGNALAFVQHGGNYGQTRTCCEAELIEYSQDCFFTWGWDKYEGARGNFIPMPYPQLARLENAWTGREKRIIYTGAEMAAYGYRLDSHPTPMQYVGYRQWKADFLGRLPENLRERIWYRPYFELPGTLADAAWLMPRFPELHLCEGPLEPQILDCGLLVLDHHGTVLLQAMAAGIPLILFWNRRDWLLAESCEELIDMLEECGVWHPSPEAAAKKLMEVWPDTAEWWRAPDIARARKIFCERQARPPHGDLNKIWIGELSGL